MMESILPPTSRCRIARALTTVIGLAFLCAAGVAHAVEHVRFERNGAQQSISGELIVTARDGGLLLQSADGVLWTIPPDEILQRSSDDTPFAPLTRQQIASKLLADLPAGFSTHETQHYLICHNTSQAYATWCGALLERLYRAFTNYWGLRGFDLHEPRFPLVAVLFSDAETYRTFARPDLGDAASSVVGYYNLQTNRMMMHDLTGVDSLRRSGDQRGSAAQINLMLSRPAAAASVATIVHEATHQIAFNSGLMTRYADIPLWVSEGIALYFETPDLGSSQGWRTIGAVNRPRLVAFRDYMSRRPPGSLQSLISGDERFRNTRTGAEAYAEAWALTYFLIRRRSDDYQKYLTALSQKGPLVWDDPETRLAEFTAAFGPDLEQLDRAFLRFIAKVR